VLKLSVICAVVCCFNYSVYPGASDSHHLMGYWAHRGLPNFCLSLGSNLCFLLCSLC